MTGQAVFLLSVALGGAVGALMRVLVGTVVSGPGDFPLNTFIVNFAGCFLISLVYFSLGAMNPEIKGFLLIGVFGAFTTMSTFSLETINLYEAGRVGLALTNIALNTAVCLGAGFAGRALALALA
ncbi:MAG: CrcB family protein [Candidatus Methanomethylophilaceae archaeon]|nr:CrcB family protein [Candidatus Methanomethylophilaceae archaeon]